MENTRSRRDTRRNPLSSDPNDSNTTHCSKEAPFDLLDSGRNSIPHFQSYGIAETQTQTQSQEGFIVREGSLKENLDTLQSMEASRPASPSVPTKTTPLKHKAAPSTSTRSPNKATKFPIRSSTPEADGSLGRHSPCQSHGTVLVQNSDSSQESMQRLSQDYLLSLAPESQIQPAQDDRGFYDDPDEDPAKRENASQHSTGYESSAQRFWEEETRKRQQGYELTPPEYSQAATELDTQNSQAPTELATQIATQLETQVDDGFGVPGPSTTNGAHGGTAATSLLAGLDPTKRDRYLRALQRNRGDRFEQSPPIIYVNHERSPELPSFQSSLASAMSDIEADTCAVHVPKLTDPRGDHRRMMYDMPSSDSDRQLADESQVLQELRATSAEPELPQFSYKRGINRDLAVPDDPPSTWDMQGIEETQLVDEPQRSSPEREVRRESPRPPPVTTRHGPAQRLSKVDVAEIVPDSEPSRSGPEPVASTSSGQKKPVPKKRISDSQEVVPESMDVDEEDIPAKVSSPLHASKGPEDSDDDDDDDDIPLAATKRLPTRAQAFKNEETTNLEKRNHTPVVKKKRSPPRKVNAPVEVVPSSIPDENSRSKVETYAASDEVKGGGSAPNASKRKGKRKAEESRAPRRSKRPRLDDSDSALSGSEDSPIKEEREDYDGNEADELLLTPSSSTRRTKQMPPRRDPSRRASATPRTNLRSAKKNLAEDCSLGVRVFAKWSGTFYPGTVQHSGAKRGSWHVVFDDGDRSDVKLEEICRLELQPGDVIKVKDIERTIVKVLPRRKGKEESLLVSNNKGLEMKVLLSTICISAAAVKASWTSRMASTDYLTTRPPSSRASSAISHRSAPRDLPFSECSIILTSNVNSGKDEKTSIAKVITRNGGTVIANWDSVVDYEGDDSSGRWWILEQNKVEWKDSKSKKVFLVSADSNCQTVKYLMAVALGVPCLSRQWIEECVSLGQRVGFEPYLLPQGRSEFLGIRVSQFVNLNWGEDEDTEDFSVMNNTVAPKVFRDLSVLCVGKDLFSDHDKEWLPKIIILMGAKTVETVKDSKHALSALTDYDYIVTDTDVYRPAWDKLTIVRTWDWVKDCLITGRLVPPRS